MRNGNYWTRTRLSRRRLIGAGGATAAGIAGLGLVGCGNDDDNGNGTAPTNTPGANGEQGQTPDPNRNGEYQRGGTHTTVWETEPSGQLDPHLMKSGFVAPITLAVYDGFLREDNANPGELKGMLAESWEQPEQDTFVFNLRQGVKFHDGSDFDADVALWNAERILGSGFVMEGGYTGPAAGISNIEVVDTHTIRFTFETPAVNAIEAFIFDSAQGITGAVSREAGEAAGAELWQNPVGTGPYRFEDWDFGSRIVLRRNEEYYEQIDGEQLPWIDELQQIALPDIAVRATNVRSGQISSTVIQPDQVRDLEGDDLYIVQGGPEQLQYYPNHTQGVFANAHVRRALAYAIDADAVAEAAFFGQAQRTRGIPENSKWHDPSFEGFVHDPERARQELEAAGMPDGFEFECMVLPTGIRTTAVEFMQAQLAELGIRVNIAPTESATYVDRLMVRAEGDCFFALTGTLGTTETGGFEANGLPNPGRRQNPDDEMMQQMVDEIRSTFDEEERRELIHEAQRYYFNDLVAVVPALDAFRPHAVRSEWAGFTMLPPNFFYPDYRQVRLRA